MKIKIVKEFLFFSFGSPYKANLPLQLNIHCHLDMAISQKETLPGLFAMDFGLFRLSDLVKSSLVVVNSKCTVRKEERRAFSNILVVTQLKFMMILYFGVECLSSKINLKDLF